MTDTTRPEPTGPATETAITPASPPPRASRRTSEELTHSKTAQARSLISKIRSYRKKLDKLEQVGHSAIQRYRFEQELKPYQAELIKMQRYLEERSQRMVILFEGRSAAGKGGAIRRITRYMNEKHYRVVSLGKPSEVESSQWYLQRYVSELPRGGEVVLFDTSWYGRAMVEPVLGFCSPSEYRHFIKGVGGFEYDLIQQGTILIKLYFSISRREQQRRFDRRLSDPLRQWKLDEADIQIQQRRDEFTAMKYRMLRHTHTLHAPWNIIRSDTKHDARLNAMKVILNSVPYGATDTDLDLTPDPAVVISGARELEIMQAQRLRNGNLEE